MALIWSPDRVSTISPLAWATPLAVPRRRRDHVLPRSSSPCTTGARSHYAHHRGDRCFVAALVANPQQLEGYPDPDLSFDHEPRQQHPLQGRAQPHWVGSRIGSEPAAVSASLRLGQSCWLLAASADRAGAGQTCVDQGPGNFRYLRRPTVRSCRERIPSVRAILGCMSCHTPIPTAPTAMAPTRTCRLCVYDFQANSLAPLNIQASRQHRCGLRRLAWGPGLLT